MSRKNTLIIVLALLLVCIYFAFRMYLVPSMKIATGYATKYVCSATFISGLDEKVISSDLDFSLVKRVKYMVNHKEKYVEGTLFGMAKQRAWFKKTEQGCGCVVTSEKPVYDQSIKDIPGQTYQVGDSLYWPVGDRLNDTLLTGVDYEKLQKVVAETIDSNKATRAILVTYKNFLLAEAYAPGIDQNTRLLGWSMTKTMSNALIGNLVKNGMIDINKPADIEEWKNDGRKNITISHLLQMSSGLDWEEDYGKLSNVTRMLYLTPDMVNYSLQPQLRSAPDSEWVYSSGTSNILSGIIRSTFATEKEYLDFPYDSLFNVLGMRSAVLETDKANNYVFSSYCWATARDWTRFGLLYLNEGNWFGKQVFTPEWTRYSTTPAASSEGQYGAQIWLNAGRKEMPSAPPGAYYEDGFGGQRVLMIPSMDIAVVMLSGQQKDFDFNEFLARVLDCFEN